MSTSLQPSVYQVLVDRGWRRYYNLISLSLAFLKFLWLMLRRPSLRSGTYYYKPDNQYSCCPQYTIRYRVAQSLLEDVLNGRLAWMRQLLIREETSVKRSIDGTSTLRAQITLKNPQDFARRVERK